MDIIGIESNVAAFIAFKFRQAKILLMSLLFILIAHSLLGGEPDKLFLSEDLINIELKSDFSAILRNRVGNPEYFDGELTYKDSSGGNVSLPVKVMVRGHFRRDPEHCSFPPLFINFKKNEVKNTIFENQDRLKLITPCQDEEDVLEEYTIYKMYNYVTNLSFRTRLVRITYFDTSTDQTLFEKVSFFLEDRDHLAARNNAHVRNKFITPFDLNVDNVEKMSVFQYIIGNKDWYITSRKNIVILQPADTTQAPVAVPYDFDFSGLVDADYTKPKGVPDNRLPDRRVFKGICMSSNDLNGVLKFYKELKPGLESIINEQELIPQRSKKQMLAYLDYFYSMIKIRGMVRQAFLDKCETREDYNISAYKNQNPGLPGKQTFSP